MYFSRPLFSCFLFCLFVAAAKIKFSWHAIFTIFSSNFSQPSVVLVSNYRAVLFLRLVKNREERKNSTAAKITRFAVVNTDI